MLQAILRLFPPDLEVDNALGRVLQVSDPDMARLLGISLHHSSHLHQLGRGEWVPAVRLLELFGLPIIQLAVAHTIHLSGAVATAGDASRATANAIQPLYLKLIPALQVRTLAKFGRSVSCDQSLPSLAMLRSLTNQVIGAYAICQGYGGLHRVIEQYCEIQGPPQTEHPNFKTALQAYSQRRWDSPPRYTLLQASGPEHAKTFTVEVTTGRQMLGVGTGNSRKTAEEAAARQYLSKYAPDFLDQKISKLPQVDRMRPSAPSSLSSERRGDLKMLAERLEIGPNALGLLDIALTHASFQREHRTPSDNTLLAHLGSHILDAVASEILLMSLSRWPLERLRSYNPRIVIAAVLSNAHIEEGFDILRLSGLLQTGRSVLTVLPSMKTEAFQAIIGAMLRSKGRPRDLSDILSDDLYDWLQNAVDRVAGLERAAVNKKSKSRLQEYLQPLNLKPQYTTTIAGPEHSQSFNATLHISIPGAPDTFRLSGCPAKRKSLAEEDAAKAAVGLLETLLGESQWPPDCWTNPTFKRFGEGLIAYAARIWPPSQPKSWRRINLLCAERFASGDWLRTALWAENVAKLFEDSSLAFDAANFTSYVASLAPASTAQAEQFSTALGSVTEFVASLSPEKPAPAMRTTTEFRLLLALAEVARVETKDLVAHFLPEVFDDFLLIRNRRSPIVVVLGVPSVQVVFREGALHSMLNRVITSLEEHGSKEVTITVAKCDRSIEITLSTDAIDNAGRGLASAEDVLLWPVLRQELFVTQVSADPTCIRLRMPVVSNDGSFISAALIAFLRCCKMMDKEEAEIVARLLHDLKNELIGYDLSLRQPQPDRTARHRALFDASVHLDAALALVQSLQGVRGGILPPVASLISPRDLLRDYLLTRLGTVPGNIRLESPRNLADDRVGIPAEYIRSILDNLLRNSVEAMPNGGEVGLDWTFSQSESKLYIALWDTGPGLDAESIQRVMTGEGLPTQKRHGSGLGIVSIQRMLAKLDGCLRVESSPGSGTYWQFCIPVEKEASKDSK